MPTPPLVKELTAANWEQEVVKSDKPVLVDFWATWCGPCLMLAPIVEQIAGEFAGRAVVGKLDVDKQADIAQRYGIQAMPTLMVFQGGRVIDQVVGARPKAELTRLLDGVVSLNAAR